MGAERLLDVSRSPVLRVQLDRFEVRDVLCEIRVGISMRRTASMEGEERQGEGRTWIEEHVTNGRSLPVNLEWMSTQDQLLRDDPCGIGIQETPHGH